MLSTAASSISYLPGVLADAVQLVDDVEVRLLRRLHRLPRLRQRDDREEAVLGLVHALEHAGGDANLGWQRG